MTEVDRLLREVERLRADLAAAHALLCSEDQRYTERIAELERANANHVLTHEFYLRQISQLAAQVERLTQERE